MNLDVLRERARIIRAIRRFFDEQGFLEVETAVRIPAPAPEEHIDCPPVEGGGYLRASPELQMKKLLAAGLDKIYQIGPCFREGERGSRHNPEFTMIEWYRRNADYRDIRDDLEGLLRRLFGVADDRPLDFSTLSVRDAYLRFAGWDPWAEWDQDRFDFDMATKIEPALGKLGGVFLMDYPPQAASLARLAFGAGRVAYAERWEFYYRGMELANCFTELCDRDEQTRRFRQARAARRALGEADYPTDEAFLACLPQIESAAGVALGVDRLVMALTGVGEISSVRAKI
ncbi:MAG: amino acid--tRNA ligase-related protein [Kiritimatiellia bacterium]